MEFRVSHENRPMKHGRVFVIITEVDVNENTCEFCNKPGGDVREHGTGVEVAHRKCASAEDFELGGSD